MNKAAELKATVEARAAAYAGPQHKPGLSIVADNRPSTIQRKSLNNAISLNARHSIGFQPPMQVAQLACSICRKNGHNRNNRKFHPLKKTYKHIFKVDSTFILNKHGKLQGKGQFARVFTKRSKLTSAHKGKTNVYVYFDYKALRNKRGIAFANFMLEELQRKYDNANRLIQAGAETATIGSAVHEATSSHQFAEAQYKKVHGNLTGLPKNPSGTTNIRATAAMLNPTPVGLFDNHGNPPRQDVDEFVSRNYGGTGSHATAPVLGQNQGFMESYSNSQAGSVDTSVVAHAKTAGLSGTQVSTFKLRRTSSFTHC
jgi:hypothetical protein